MEMDEAATVRGSSAVRAISKTLGERGAEGGEGDRRSDLWAKGRVDRGKHGDPALGELDSPVTCNRWTCCLQNVFFPGTSGSLGLSGHVFSAASFFLSNGRFDWTDRQD